MLLNVLKVLGLFLISIDWCRCGDYCTDNPGTCLNGLTVTYAAPDSTNPYAFNKMPRTTKDAEDQKWTKSGNGCEDSTLPYKGTRYLDGNDFGFMILYDKNGYVAGVQTTIPKDKADNNGVIKYSESEVAYTETLNNIEYVVFTMYFIDPQTICNGRSKEDFDKQTVEKLYIRKGPDAYTEVSTVENKRSLEADGWELGKCVLAMGTHYTRFLHDCVNYYPIFLMYDYTNKNQMPGFGFNFFGYYDHSPRLEHASLEKISFSLYMPPCFKDYFKKAGGFTAIHIYNDPKPKDIKCNPE